MNELCFNLWYYLDRQQNIVAISAMAYLLGGSDDEKASSLLAHSGADYHRVSPREINAMHYSGLTRLGIEDVFKGEFERIRREQPNGVAFPEDKLFYATPLFDFGHGFVPAEVGNGFIRERE